MRDDKDVVLGDGEVEFEDVGADLNAIAETRQRVLSAVGATTAMRVDEDGARGAGWRRGLGRGSQSLSVRGGKGHGSHHNKGRQP